MFKHHKFEVGHQDLLNGRCNLERWNSLMVKNK